MSKDQAQMVENRFIQCLLVLTLCCLTTFAQKPTSEQLERYAKGVSEGMRAVRIFPNDPWKFRFSLTTSWIPGPEHKGFFRYQLQTGLILSPTMVGQKFNEMPGMPETLSELGSCHLHLQLYDDGGFLLQKIPLIFESAVNESSAVTGLIANDSSQMDLGDYKRFLRANPDLSWNISWSCPDQK